jgi:AraC-like DNA-binding protein
VETVASLPARRLRSFVAGYGGFRFGVRSSHRPWIPPLNLTALVIDFAGPARLVVGPRTTALTYERPGWRHGVAVGLTPAGVSAVFGVPAGELAGGVAPLADLVGGRGDRIADQLGVLPDWPARFAALDAWLTARLRTDREPQDVTTRAWWRLLNASAPITIGALARGFGLSQRHLQARFRTHVGLSPKTVARVARFQHALHALSGPAASLAVATECGYADQSHFHRETRAMTDMTPGELFAFVQDTGGTPD